MRWSRPAKHRRAAAARSWSTDPRVRPSLVFGGRDADGARGDLWALTGVAAGGERLRRMACNAGRWRHDDARRSTRSRPSRGRSARNSLSISTRSMSCIERRSGGATRPSWSTRSAADRLHPRAVLVAVADDGSVLGHALVSRVGFEEAAYAPAATCFPSRPWRCSRRTGAVGSQRRSSRALALTDGARSHSSRARVAGVLQPLRLRACRRPWYRGAVVRCRTPLPGSSSA